MRKAVKGILKFILSRSKVNKVLIGKNKGLKLYYNDDLNLDMVLGFHEPNTFEVFDLFIKEGMTVVDIGANVGYFTRFLSKKVGTGGTVYAFEPIPATFETLKKTIALNKLTNIVSVNKASSDHNGTVTMYLSHSHYMSSLDKDWANTGGGETEVPCVTIDSYFDTAGGSPDFIKMDIEGGGVYALKGMVNTIRKNEPVLFLESHTPQEDKAIGEALSLVPYDVYRVGSAVPVKSTDKDYTDQYGIYGTVIGIPKSKKHLYGDFNPNQFQRKRFGQRD